MGSAVAAGAEGLGIGAATAGAIGTGVEGALLGGGLGAAEGAITGQSPLKGAEFGALTGGAIGGLSPVIGSVTGLGATASDVLAGTAGGALGGVATGKSPLTGALEGAGAGLTAGTLRSLTSSPTGTGPTSTPSAPVGGGVSSAASTAAPSSIGAETGGVTTDAGSAVASKVPGSVGAGAASGGSSTAGLSKFGDFLSSPSTLLTLGGLGASLARGKPKIPDESVIKGEASQLLSRGNRLSSFIETGQLPVGLQTTLDNATRDAQTTIKSEYARLGLSGSSPEAQDLENVALRSQGQGADIAMKLLSQGTTDTQLGTSLYQYLIGINLQQDEALSQSIGNFASAFSGLGKPVPVGA